MQLLIRNSICEKIYKKWRIRYCEYVKKIFPFSSTYSLLYKISMTWKNLPTKLCFISEIFWLILSFIKNRRVLSVISLVLFSYKISRAHSLKICSESSNFPISLWMQKLFLWYVLYDGYEKNYLQIEGNHYEQYKGKALLI